MAETLADIATTLEEGNALKAEDSEQAEAILTSLSEIGVTLLNQSRDIDLKGLSAVVLTEDAMEFPLNELVPLQLATGDRVSVVFLGENSNGYASFRFNGAGYGARLGELVYGNYRDVCKMEYQGVTDSGNGGKLLIMCDQDPSR